MRAVYIDKPFSSSVHETELPELKSDEVLIKVSYAGVCGSDLHAYRGKHAFRKPPVRIGHEMSGIVEQVGSDVTRFKIGDAVTVMPQISCGRCEKCKSNRAHLCAEKILPSMKGWNGQGTFADYFTAPEKVVCSIDGIDPELGALTEPLAVAVHMMSRIPDKHSDKLTIIGAGTIGLLLLAISKFYGFKDVLVTDLEDFNLQKAFELGASEVVNVSRTDAVSAVKNYFGENGCDNILVAAGGPSIIGQTLEIAAPGANILFTAMITSPSEFVSYPIVYKELNFLGSFNYIMDDFIKATYFLKTEGTRIRTIITHHFSMEDVDEAFQLFDTKKEPCIKIVLDVNNVF